jgi:hypothetical protein
MMLSSLIQHRTEAVPFWPALARQHTRRRQIPIAPAALSVPHTPQFRALALFGRRLSERGDGLGMPASENLHNRRHRAAGRHCYPIWSTPTGKLSALIWPFTSVQKQST